MGPALQWLAGLVRAAWIPYAIGQAARFGRPAETARPIRHALVIALDEIGDAVMLTPFIREARRSFPGARVTLVVSPAAAPIFETCPYVDAVVVYRAARRRWLRLLQFHIQAAVFARRFQADPVDLAIVPRWGVDQYGATPIAYFSGAPVRVGYSAASPAARRMNRGFDLLLTRAVDDRRPAVHEVERSLDLLRALGCRPLSDHLEVWPSADDLAAAARIWREQGLARAGAVVALGPSPGHSPLKQWPVDRFVDLGRQLLTARPGLRIVVLGACGDRDVAGRLARGIGPAAVNLAGGVTLRQAAAVLARCALFVGNDNGLMHLAAAAGVRMVALFGPSCPHRFGPWREEARVMAAALPCGPCRTHRADRCSRCSAGTLWCMDSISVAGVAAAAEEQLRAVENSPGAADRWEKAFDREHVCE